MTNIFTINEVVKYSWEKVKKHLGFFILMSLIIFLVSYIPGLFNKTTETGESQFTLLGFLISLIFTFISILISIGVVKITLDLVYSKTEAPKIKELFSHINLFIKYFLASLLVTIIVFVPSALILGLFVLMIVLKVGTIVKIILGVLGLVSIVFMIIYSIRLSYYPYFIVDGSGIIESIKKSYKITKGMVWSLIVLGIVLGLINLLGLLCLFVGLLITLPISYVAMAYVYKKLKEANLGDSVVAEIKPEIPQA